MVTGLNIPKALWKWVTLGTRHTDTILQFRNKQQHRALRGCGAQNMQERSWRGAGEKRAAVRCSSGLHFTYCANQSTV